MGIQGTVGFDERRSTVGFLAQEAEGAFIISKEAMGLDGPTINKVVLYNLEDQATSNWV